MSLWDGEWVDMLYGLRGTELAYKKVLQMKRLLLRGCLIKFYGGAMRWIKSRYVYWLDSGYFVIYIFIIS